MKKGILGMILALSMLALVGCAGGSGDRPTDSTKTGSETITISAAASLQNAMDEIKANYVKKNNLKPDQIVINYGGSGTLRQQIEQGAPASIFISASESHMKSLQDKQLMDEVKPFITNSLVVIVPKDKPQLKINQLVTANKVALGTPETVPAGKYAQTMFERMNLWTQVQPKVIFAKDVRAVLNYVMQGAVDAGLVYKTDAMEGKDKVVITDTAPEGTTPAINYPMGMIKKHENQLTKDFYAYLQTDEAKTVLERYGFGVVK